MSPDSQSTTPLGFLGLSRVNINQDMCLVSQAVRRHQNHSTDYMCVQGIMLNNFSENFTHKHFICINPATTSQSYISFCIPSPPFKSMTSSLISMITCIWLVYDFQLYAHFFLSWLLLLVCLQTESYTAF